MIRRKIDKLPANSRMNTLAEARKTIVSFFSRFPSDPHRPELTHSSPMPLFRLEKCHEKHTHLLKKKDLINAGPIINYFIHNSGQVAYMAGDAVNNFYIHRKRRYSRINILVVLTTSDMEKYSGILNNIISSNDGAFSMGQKYWVRKNRSEGCFRDIAQARYVIEPRLESIEKILFLFRPAAIELDLITQNRFSAAFGMDVIDEPSGQI